MNTATASSLIAVPDLAGAHVAGVIVYWRLAGVVDYEALEAAWATAGLDQGLLPAPIARTTALKRTMASFKEASVLVRPLKGDEEGFVLVHESYDAEGRPQYRNGRTVTFWEDPDTGALEPLVHALPDEDPEGAEVTELQRQVDATFARHLNHLTQQDISGWLVDLVRGVHSVRLRDTGGIYFVPRDRADAWRAYVAALRAASRHRLFEIPAMQSDEAVASILDALTREAREAAEDLEDELDAKDLSAKALRGREAKARETETKIATYEALLGVKLEALRAEYDALQARVAAAILAAEAD